ncbi:NfeD family protein [Halomarina oriensis]|uniref:NfeD family protein n=1 Tax=Halomarina oriensis TaxID=671145 RepID=A0A6B0GKL1_9EURY|nr:NfeD family protein [Halomarina oriensis]MWG35466.1 NfeD family protein [Halomarina oriensis]
MEVLQLGEIFGLSVPVLLLLAGTGLIVAEAVAPGAQFVVLGVALLVAGLVGLVFGAGLVGLLAMTLSMLVAGAATFYAFREYDVYGSGGSSRTRDSDSLKGTTGRVTERVSTSDGEVKLDAGGFNPYYRARSMEGEIPEGTEVMVVDPGGGNVITVEPVDAVEDSIDRQLRRDREQKGTTGGDSESSERDEERETA